jgi:hypothetical protein
MAQKICVFLTCEQLRRDCDAGLVVSRIEDRLGLWKIVLQAHLQRTNGSTFKRFFVKFWDKLRQKAFRFVSFRFVSLVFCQKSRRHYRTCRQKNSRPSSRAPGAQPSYKTMVRNGRPLFVSALSLCLSRACLGKMIVFKRGSKEIRFFAPP